MEPEGCAECGFDGSRLTIDDAIALLRTMGPRWRERFAGNSDDRLRRRPAPEVWSPLEYAAHTRDIVRLHHIGIGIVFAGQELAIPAVEPDPPGADHGYNAQEPARVLDELTAACAELADLADEAPDGGWGRTWTAGGISHDAGWALRHAVHDASHHLMDIERDLGG